MPRRSRKNGEFGPIRWSIFKPWWAIRSTIFPACRWSGPKVAGEWLGKFGTLDNLLAHADELPKGKRKENLLAGRDQIAGQPPTGAARFGSADYRSIGNARMPGSFDPAGAAEFFAEFGFHALTNQMRDRWRRPMRRHSRIATKRLPRRSDCNGWSTQIEQAEADFARHGNHEHLPAVGRDCRLFIRLERR